MRTGKIAIIGQRILFGGVLFFLAPAVIRLIKGPVTMFTDFPTTASLILCVSLGLIFTWLSWRRIGLLILVCDFLLAVLGYFYLTDMATKLAGARLTRSTEAQQANR